MRPRPQVAFSGFQREIGNPPGSATTLGASRESRSMTGTKIGWRNHHSLDHEDTVVCTTLPNVVTENQSSQANDSIVS